MEDLRASLATLANLGSPVILGAALEGPFVSPARAGALPREFLLPPDVQTFRSLVLGFKKFVRIVALAPELPGAFSLLSEILRLGAIPALGHTDADYLTAGKPWKPGLPFSSTFLTPCGLFTTANPAPWAQPWIRMLSWSSL
jgi:N-acetylglucosamine-6-phosphate deacetylase